MLNESNIDWMHQWLCGLVNQEASKLGKDGSVATDFCNAIRFMVKGGALADSISGKISWSMGSLTGLPVKTPAGTTYTYYHYGTFVDGMNGGAAAITTASNIGWNNYAEGMRQSVNDALKTW
jgi:hypothetical protein